MLTSSLCTEESFSTDAFLRWAEILPLDRMAIGSYIDEHGHLLYLHRKVWEWIFIAEALHERDMLRPGRRGVGFGVGREPLAALFASFGCEILATDLNRGDAAEAGWVRTGQYAAAFADLNHLAICDPAEFDRRVAFREVDMNIIPSDIRDFDFCWSACSLEHLGSIAHGQEFVLNSMDCIRPGGVAVHTTEYNVSSNRRTVDNDATVLFRQRDVKWLVSQLRILGHSVTDPDLRAGAGPADRHIDAPPYSKTHLKVEIAEHVATSLGLVAEKAAVVPRSRPWRTDLLLQTRMGKSRLIHSFRNTSSETSRLYLARRVIRRGLRETEQAWRQLNERLTRVWPSKAEIGPSHPPFENIAAYLIWRTLTGDRVVDVCWTNGTGRLAALALCGKDVLGLDVGQGPSSGGHRAQPLVCGRLVQLPLRTNHADIVSVFDLLQTLDPADVKGAVDELERVSARYVFATIPSFGVDTLSPPNGSLAGKVQPEHLAFYESLGESYEGPVPLEHVRRSESDPDFPQLCTVASIVWWTRIFEQAGLIRCAGLEQRLVPLLTRFGVYGHWKIYVLRRSDVQEPIGEVHTEVEIAAVEAALGMAAPVSPASSTGPPFRQ